MKARFTLLLMLFALLSSASDGIFYLSQKDRDTIIPLFQFRRAIAPVSSIRDALNKNENEFQLIDSSAYHLKLDSNYWLKCEIVNADTVSARWVLDLRWISYATVYFIDTKGSIQTLKAGRMLTRSQKDFMEIGNEYVEFSLKSLERKTVYISGKTVNPTPQVNDFMFVTQKEFAHSIKMKYLRYGLYFGIFGLIVLASLLLAAFLRLRIYLFFALYVLSFSVYLAYLLNIFTVYVFSETVNHVYFFELQVYSSFFFYASLLKFILQDVAKTRLFVLARRAWLVYIICSFTVNACCISNASLFLWIQYILISVNLGIALMFVVFAFKMRTTSVRFFIAGTFVTVVSALLVQFDGTVANFELDIVANGLLVEVILVAIGITYSYREVAKQRSLEISELLSTLQKQEIQLKEANSKLEMKVRERTAEINDKTIKLEHNFKELEELNALKNKFLSIIGHDLKNPLGTVIGFSNLLQENIDTYNKEKIKLFANQIHQSTTHTYQLLINLLEWARSQTNLVKMSPEPVVLNALLEETLSLLQDMADKKEISIEITELDKSRRIMVDINMMKTILRNLLSNAIKYSNVGGKIEISASIAQHAVIKVKDYGVGMPEDHLNKLFRIDQNASTPGTDNEDGTGLGLIIVHEFIQKMRGTIHVDSKPDEGTTFTLIIPVGLPNRE